MMMTHYLPLVLSFFALFNAVFSGNVALSSQYNFGWEIDTATSTIYFSINVTRIGWVGIGWHAVGSAGDQAMIDADVIIVAVNDAGDMVANDYYAQTFAAPPLDVTLGGKDDVLDPRVDKTDTGFQIVFSRKLVTGDRWDVPITVGPMKVIWALGTSTTLDYHGYDPNNRGSAIVNFFEDDPCGPTVGCRACVARPQCIYCAADTLCYDKTNPGKCTPLNSTCNTVCPSALGNAWTPPGYCASVWVDGLANPRGLITAPNGDLLLVEAGRNRIVVFWISSSGQIDRAVLATASGINHGITIDGTYLYASSPTTVYRWKYMPGQRENLGSPQTVVSNVPCCHHSTRTLVVDSVGLLYVQSGSGSNVDPDSTHARIRRFNIQNLPANGFTWNDGELFADGLRNEVGLSFDSQGRLWGVENGCDDLNRPDLGGDIHTNNPSEEVNFFPVTGKFYGYPYCWSEYDLPVYGKGKGTQWVHPDFMGDGIHSDDWCRNTSNVVVPSYNLLAHQAPLDIKFYYKNYFPGFPTGGAFIALHGSWDRQPAVGYRVTYLNFVNGVPTSETVLLRNDGNSQVWPNNVRPVNIAFNTCGNQECMYVTSDSSGQIIQISYQG